MPGTSIGFLEQGHLSPQVEYYAVEAGQTIYKGDWLVYVMEASNYNTPRVKKVTSTEITGASGTAFAETGPVIRGILGIALADIVTDSAGLPTGITPSTVEAGARAILALPTTSQGLPPYTLTEGSDAQDKGKMRLPVAIANSWTAFKMKMAAASDAVITVTNAYEHQYFGIQITNTIDFKVSTGEVTTDAIFEIVRVSETDPNFNSSSINCSVYVKVRAAYQQFALSVPWAD